MREKYLATFAYHCHYRALSSNFNEHLKVMPPTLLLWEEKIVPEVPLGLPRRALISHLLQRD